MKLELDSSKKVILCSEDTAITYKLSDIFLEYDAIFNERYATTIGDLHVGTTSTPYTKVTSVHYYTLSKKDTTWKIGVNNLFVRWLQGLLLLFLDNRHNFANKAIKKILTTINGMPHQLFATGLQDRDIYPELKNYFYKEHSNVKLKEFLTTKSELWIDTRSSTLHGSGTAVEKSSILLQFEKAAEDGDGDLT